jgi:hypothetical protein
LAADACTPDNDNDQVQGSQQVRHSPNNTKRLNKRGGGFYQQQNGRSIMDQNLINLRLLFSA